MPTPINLQQASAKYQSGTAAAVQKWQQNTAGAANLWEQNAKSAQAEQNYATGVQFAAQNQLRLKGLQNVSATDFQQAVSASGSVYQQKTAANVNKWAQRFSPYADVINSIVPSLPAKVPGDAATNVANRVTPIAVGLQQAKLGTTATRQVSGGSSGTSYGGRPGFR